MGPATNSISRRLTASRASVTAARPGAAHIDRNVPAMLASPLRSESLAVFHSSNLRFVHPMRTHVRTVASTATQASYGRLTNTSIPRASGWPNAPSVARQCMLQGRSTGLRSHPVIASHRVGRNTTPARNASMIAAAPVDRAHEPSTTASIAGGTRLRRRLSKIFQRDKADIGLGPTCPERPLTDGSSQRAICQSPRIHRCLRPMSATYREG